MTRGTKTAACWAEPARVRQIDGAPQESWGVFISVEDSTCAVEDLVVMVRTRDGRTFPRRLVRKLDENKWGSRWCAVNVDSKEEWAWPDNHPSRHDPKPKRPQAPRPVGRGTGPVAEAVAMARDAGVPDSRIKELRNRHQGNNDEFVRELRRISD